MQESRVATSTGKLIYFGSDFVLSELPLLTKLPLLSGQLSLKFGGNFAPVGRSSDISSARLRPRLIISGSAKKG